MQPTPKGPEDLTAADRSAAAATGDRETASTITALDITSPAGTQEPEVDSIGDRLTLANGTFAQVYVLEPPEDPTKSYAAYRLSPYLSPILQAISVNVYAANVGFDPVIDLNRENSNTVVREALVFEQALEKKDFEADIQISDEELKKETNRLKRRQANERQYLEHWFQRCYPGWDYRTLRTLVGLDMEINNGIAYVEVLRFTDGRPAHLLWVPGWSIRPLPVDPTLIPVHEPVQLSKLRWTREWHLRRFTKYVQIDGNDNVQAYFKEYGDPRVLSRKTGKYYLTYEQMQASEDELYTAADGSQFVGQPATELLDFKLPTPTSTAFGKSEFTGIYPGLIGARDLEEENPNVLVDRKVPQLFILVSGGTGISKDDMQLIEQQIATNNRLGKKAIYFLQARSVRQADGKLSANPSVEIVKTKSEQYADALGLNYLKHVEDTVDRGYRMPKAEMGITEGTKDDRAYAHRFAESQVYDPRRDIIDGRINSTVIRDLGIQTVVQHTRSRTPKDPNELADLTAKMSQAGALTPDDSREIARLIFDKDFPELLGVWSKLPKELLTALLQTKNQLVAAALLNSDERGDILPALREALSTRRQSSKPQNPEGVPVPGAGEVLDDGGDKKKAGSVQAGSEGGKPPR
jgi:capsid portal protein